MRVGAGVGKVGVWSVRMLLAGVVGIGMIG